MFKKIVEELNATKIFKESKMCLVINADQGYVLVLRNDF